MSFRVSLTPAAAESLSQIPRRDRLRLVGVIELLAQDPFPPKALKLKGREGWRVRVGDYRLIYAVDGRVLVVLVIKIGHRRDVYHQG